MMSSRILNFIVLRFKRKALSHKDIPEFTNLCYLALFKDRIILHPLQIEMSRTGREESQLPSLVIPKPPSSSQEKQYLTIHY